MATRSIQDDLNRIMTAIYGEEVRGSIHDAIETCYDDVQEGRTVANAAADNATAKANLANAAAATANAAATNANNKADIATASATAADDATAATNAAIATANSAASNANAKAALADEKATLADTKAALANTAAGTADAAAATATTKANLADEKATLANTAASTANTAASNADAKATLANTAAETANTAAANANTKATLAYQKATLADTAATTANTAATNANTKASLAEEKAALANTKAALADEKATLADAKATLANNSATAANAAASNATTAAGTANTAAGTANTAASNADTKAALADTKATLAAEKAALAVTAANTATSAANTANTAAGNADNATTAANTAAATATSAASTATTAASTASDAAATATSAAADAENAVEEIRHLVEQWDLDDELDGTSDHGIENQAVVKGLNTKASVITDTASGEIVTVPDGAEGIAAESLVVHMEPIQDLHGYDGPWIDSSDVNKDPYNFRAVSGTVTRIGNRLYDKIVGGTVAWNQMINPATAGSTTVNGVTFTSDGNGSIEVSGTASAMASLAVTATYPTYIEGHKYYICGCPADGANNKYSLRYNSNGFGENGSGAIVTAVSGSAANGQIKVGTNYPGVAVTNGTAITGTITFKPQLIDLTAMFGSTIADYIYTLEQSTAGAGVAWFRKYFPKPYYAYEAGKLESVNTSAHDMVGFNALDVTGRTEVSLANGNYPTLPNISDGIYYKGLKPDLTIRAGYVGNISLTEGNVSFTTNTTTGYGLGFPVKCLPNTTYYSHYETTTNCNAQPMFFDINGNYISKTNSGANNQQFTTPEDCFYIVYSVTGNIVGSVGVTGVTINLHGDGSRDGEYEPYAGNSYALDSSLTLRGIPKLDASNNLYYDGDVYASDGTVTRKYGIVDLGELNWLYNSSAALFYSSGLASVVAYEGMTVVANIRCANYVSTVANNYNNGVDKSISIGGAIVTKGVNIKDSSYTDAATFKTAMSGVYLIYELATPTTETASAYTSPQVTSEWGTEGYTDYSEAHSVRDVAIPVGHESYHALVCPISGRTGVTAYRTGKNLLNTVGTDTTNGYVSGKYLSNVGAEVGGYSGYITEYTPIAPSTGYIYSGFYGSAPSICFYDSSKNYISSVQYAAQPSKTFTTPSTAAYYRASVHSTEMTQAQLEVGSTASTHVSFNGTTTYPVTWQTDAGTVYGGTVDLVTGVLTVDCLPFVFDNTAWLFSSTFFYLFFDDLKDVVVSDYYMTENGVKINLNGNNGQARIYLSVNPFIASDTDVGALLNGYKLIYELKTPQTYQLTPQAVQMLLGVNNIWATEDMVDLTYPCDTKLYIEKLTQPTEDDMIANNNIAADTFFMIDNALYFSTTAISAGETIVVGTNCSRVSLADALNSLYSSNSSSNS